METKAYETIDKSAWPDGSWKEEHCDKLQWPDAATGLPCLAVRQHRWGHWCGYVAVGVSHPLFGKDYDTFDADVHGGLTFAGACSPGDESTSICHVPGQGESDRVWWFGFDCFHWNDYAPNGIGKRSGEYRSLAYVKQQCAELARQLAGAP